MRRSFLSFTALASILLGAVGPIFAQNSVKRSPQAATERGQSKEAQSKSGRGKPVRPVTPPEQDPRPARLPQQTKFGKVEVFTEGRGAYVLWAMDTEVKNAGFRLYRSDKEGSPIPVGNFILGASFRSADDVVADTKYNFYDPKGSQDSRYYIEAVNDDGRTLNSAYALPEYVDAIENIPGGDKIKEEAFAVKAGDNRVSEELKFSSELATEVQKGLLAPNPTRHLEVVSTPGAVRVASKADGLIRVTKAELQNGGFNVNSDSANWQIYLDGVELPMIIGPNADYIEFLGKAIETLDSDIRIYYLIPGATAGRRIPNQTVRPPLSSVVSRKYNQTFVRADKKIFISTLRNGEAENWFGDLASSSFFDYNFNLSGIDRTSGTRKLTIKFQGLSLTPHSVELTLNGVVLPNATGSGQSPFQREIDVPVTALIDGQNTLRWRSVGLGFNGSGQPINGDLNLLMRLSIDFPRSYTAMGNTLKFHTENYKNARVSGFTSPNIRVFDLTYEESPRLLNNLQITETSGTWGPVIPASRSQLLYAVEAGVYGSALSVTPTDPSLLGDPSNIGTMLLIAHPSLMAEANAWATYRSGQGISTKVVDVREIYDEFNFGVTSSHAIESFLLYAKNNWQTPPSYVLLFGDGHYDTKGYDTIDIGDWNMIPARQVDTLYEQTGSDEALSDFNNDGLAEIPIGRIAARTPASVTAILNKVITWEASITPTVLDRGVVFAHDRPDGYNFKAMSERVQAQLPAAVPKVNVSEAICTDDTNIFTCTANPTGKTEIVNAVNSVEGKYSLNYTGHGSVVVWSKASFFGGADAPSLSNASHPILMTALTCLNGYFMADEPSPYNNISFAESMLRPASGGASAVWASTGKTTPDVQEIMAKRFYLKLGEGNIQRLGDLINDAKAQVPAGADVRLSWALLGDPMLKVR